MKNITAIYVHMCVEWTNALRLQCKSMYSATHIYMHAFYVVSEQGYGEENLATFLELF